MERIDRAPNPNVTPIHPGVTSSEATQVFVSTQAPSFLNKDAIDLAVRNNLWIPAGRASFNRILAKGSTERAVDSGTLLIQDNDGIIEDVHVVAKRTESIHGAKQERDNLERILTETSVSTLRPLCAVSFAQKDGDMQSYLITILQKGIIPVERLAFENFPPDQRQIFLGELATFTAFLGNSGVIHRDLALRNVAYDLRQDPLQSNSLPFVLFDVERTEVLGAETLDTLMDTDRSLPPTAISQLVSFNEEMLQEGAELARELRTRLPEEEVIQEFIDPFVAAGLPMRMRPSADRERQFLRRFIRHYTLP